MSPYQRSSGPDPSPIRLGIVGMGAAARAFLPAIRSDAGFDLVAFADPAEAVRTSATETERLQGFEDLASMLDRCELDAVYVATPTELHAAQVEAALAAGKHVLVEKPMAVTLDEATRMIDAAERAGTVLAVGHSHSYDQPIRAMRNLIASGRLGRVRMVNTWCFTDWIYRPRRAGELKTDRGGGVTYRQGSHQFDIIRLLCGGLVRSVRATTFDWDPERPAIGAHSVFLEFEDGATATAVYNGYGHFSTEELNGVGEWGFPAAAETATPRAEQLSEAEELERKRKRAETAIPGSAPFQPHFGLTVVSCERGDIRQTPEGLCCYGPDGREEIALPTEISPRSLVLEEFREAILGVAPCIHDGRWGRANLEICTAAIASSKSGRDVGLIHQVPVPSACGQQGLLVAGGSFSPFVSQVSQR